MSEKKQRVFDGTSIEPTTSRVPSEKGARSAPSVLSTRHAGYTPVDPSDDATIKIHERAYGSPLVPLTFMCVPILLLILYVLVGE